jgi:ACT domain
MGRRSPKDQESPVGMPGTVCPTALTRHTPKNGFPFPPEVILGGFFFQNVPSGVESESQRCCLRVAGRLDFSMVGILAAVTVPLAAAGIPVFAISVYNTDYILVKAINLERAAEILRNAGHEVEARTDCQRPEGPDVGLADENNPCGSSAPA